MSEKEISKEMQELLDDDDIQSFFESRNPNRKKINPFLDAEVEESIRGKASSLSVKKEEKEEKIHGVSFSQHTKHVRDVSRHFFFIGSSAALFVAIILAMIF